MADAGTEFARLVQGAEDDIALDEGALLIAAHAYPDLDVAGELGRLDDLARRCPATGPQDVVAYLCEDCGFSGNRHHYDDPRNSFLNDVLRRRTGIPITLAVLAMEVGRRAGVPLSGVGLPGHFLVLGGDVLLDPFNGGRRLDTEQCQALLLDTAGPDVPFDTSLLAPVGPRAILARILANLRQIYLRSGDTVGLAWVVRLRTSIPGLPRTELVDLARALVRRGRFSEGAMALEELAAAPAPGVDSDRLRASARLLRARLN